MSDHKTNGAWWLYKSDTHWTQAELRRLKDDVPDLAEYWQVYTLFEDPFEYSPGLISRAAVDRLLLLDYAQDKRWYDSNPVITRSSAYVVKSAVAAISKMAIPFGVAVIFDQGRLTFIGREEPVDLLHAVVHKLAKRCRSMQSILPRRPGLNRKKQVAAWWDVFNEEALFVLDYYRAEMGFLPGELSHVVQGYKKRVELLKVQHQVYQVSLSFRDWHPPEGSAEVVLKPIDDDGRLLGGVVWRLDTYETEEGLAYLGL